MVTVLESKPDPIEGAWNAAVSARGDDALMLASFATDVAALDVREEKSNDPLSPLLSAGIRDVERARYVILRERHPFRVYKDRKFVVSPSLVAGVRDACSQAGCKNLVYPLR